MLVKTKLNQGFTAIDNEQPQKIVFGFITMGVFIILIIPCLKLSSAISITVEMLRLCSIAYSRKFLYLE